MRADQLSWSETTGWRSANGAPAKADLVLYFATRQALACGTRYHELRAMFPDAHILGCSTGGQIRNDEVTDHEIAAVALRFDATKLRLACEPVLGPAQSAPVVRPSPGRWRATTSPVFSCFPTA